MLARVVLIGTGGTIASRHASKLRRTAASQCGEEVLAQVSQLVEVAAIEVDDFATWNSATRVTVRDHGLGCLPGAAQIVNVRGGGKRKIAGGRKP